MDFPFSCEYWNSGARDDIEHVPHPVRKSRRND